MQACFLSFARLIAVEILWTAANFSHLKTGEGHIEPRPTEGEVARVSETERGNLKEASPLGRGVDVVDGEGAAY